MEIFVKLCHYTNILRSSNIWNCNIYLLFNCHRSFQSYSKKFSNIHFVKSKFPITFYKGLPTLLRSELIPFSRKCKLSSVEPILSITGSLRPTPSIYITTNQTFRPQINVFYYLIYLIVAGFLTMTEGHLAERYLSIQVTRLISVCIKFNSSFWPFK